MFVKPISYRKLEEMLSSNKVVSGGEIVGGPSDQEENSLKKKLDDSKYVD